jgi:hypothetical protein
MSIKKIKLRFGLDKERLLIILLSRKKPQKYRRRLSIKIDGKD